MTTTTMIRTLRYGKGYAGKLGNKCWIARITGSDKSFGLQREFLEPVKVVREHFNRPRTIIEMSYELQENELYELSAEGDRWFSMCYTTTSGEIKTAKVSEARFRAWIAALDAGLSSREARLASKGL